MQTAVTGSIYRSFDNNIHLIIFSSSQVNGDSYASEKNVARLYIGQKTWPRAVYVRKARLVKPLY